MRSELEDSPERSSSSVFRRRASIKNAVLQILATFGSLTKKQDNGTTPAVLRLASAGSS